MIFRTLAAILLLGAALQAADPIDVAKRIADRAERAREGGEVVRAYLLFDEAAKRDPSNPTYAARRDGLSSTANLLFRSQLEKPIIARDIDSAEREAEAAAHPTAPGLSELIHSLESLPHVQPSLERRNFDLKGDEATLIRQVAQAFGVRAALDPQLDSKTALDFRLDDADFRTALNALTLVTNTFVFPVSNNTLFFARDSQAKRNELEPFVVLTVPLPESMNEKDLIDVANAVRGVLNLRSFGWDSVSRTVFIRDRVTQAMAARALLEALLLPRAQVSMEVQVLTFDSDTAYHYGLALPGSTQIAPFGQINHFTPVQPDVGTFTRFFSLGGGHSLLGIGVTQASLIAAFSKSTAKTSYDAVAVTMDGQPASMHMGEKYPIPQTLYTGAAQSAPSIYNPIGQFTQEDLGLVLKLTPHVNGSGEVAIDVEAEYKALGAIVLNTVPSVSQRKFTGNVVLREGEWAVLAGLDQRSLMRDTNGVLGLANVPGLRDFLAANNRTVSETDTLIVIKPTITRLPMSAAISPQYLVGPTRGIKVLL